MLPTYRQASEDPVTLKSKAMTTLFRHRSFLRLYPLILALFVISFVTTGREVGLAQESKAPIIAYEGKGYLVEEDQEAPQVAKIPYEWQSIDNGFFLPLERDATMEPIENYSGPKFQVGLTAEITGSGLVESNGQSAMVLRRSGSDAISMILGIGRDSEEAKTVTMEGVVLFPADTQFAISNPNAFSATVSNSFSGAKPEGRWVVKTSDGRIYASEETFRLGQPTFSTDLTTTRWLVVDTSGGKTHLDKNSTALSDANILSQITGAGVYVGGQRAGVSGKGGAAATAGFRVQRFVVEP